MPDMPKMHRPEPGQDAGIEDIEADLERTRHELGDTAHALAAKLDVPGQARAKLDETKHRVAEKAEPLRQNAVPLAAAGFGAVVIIAVVRRRRRRRRALQ